MKYECHERGETRTAWRPRPDGLEELVQFTPGYRCRAVGPHSHGRHGMEIRFVLRGHQGATQFLMFTDWIPGERGGSAVADLFPMGADVGYHARQPQYEGHLLMTEHCEILDGPCYYDGSGLRATDLTREFIAHGEDVIWMVLAADLDFLTYEPVGEP